MGHVSLSSKPPFPFSLLVRFKIMLNLRRKSTDLMENFKAAMVVVKDAISQSNDDVTSDKATGSCRFTGDCY